MPLLVHAFDTVTSKNVLVPWPEGGSGGNWELLATYSIPGSTALVDISLDYPGHRNFRVEWTDVRTSTGDEVYMLTSADGVSWATGESDYSFSKHYIMGVGTQYDDASPFISLTYGTRNLAGDGATGYFDIWSPLDAAVKTLYSGLITEKQWSDGRMHPLIVGGRRDALGVVEAIRLYPRTGNFVGGVMRLFGWND